MAMLAAKKRKQRWSLNPRGKTWTEDSNKFGQRMLEKMGWTHGKGLGANEDGIKEQIKLSYKNDSKGMGYKEVEGWTEHEENFTKLLANLGGSTNTQTSPDTKPKSLQEKSQKSRVRVHYHKFTKGKDLSRYSDKDLANIFGKKTLKPHEQMKAGGTKSDRIETNGEHKNLVERGSMTSYFKNKMPNFTLNDAGYAVKNESASELAGACCGFGYESKKKGFDRNHAFTESKKRKLCETLQVNEVRPKQKPKRKHHGINVSVGQSNPAFDPMFNNVVVKKHALKTIEETVEETESMRDVAFEEKLGKLSKKSNVKTETPEISVGEEKECCSKPHEESATGKRKKPKGKQGHDKVKYEGIFNPAFNPKEDVNVTLESEEIENIENPGPNATSESIHVDDSLLLNVVSLPSAPPKKTVSDSIVEKMPHDGSFRRRKSVTSGNDAKERIMRSGYNDKMYSAEDISNRNELFDINTKIIQDGLKAEAMKKRKLRTGVDNACFDRRANIIQENIESMSNAIDTLQAEVENDMNEAKSKCEVMVGEVGEPCHNHSRLANGVTRLSFRGIAFRKTPAWMKNKAETSRAKNSYKHLVRGDIILAFKNTNLHEIVGYATTK